MELFIRAFSRLFYLLILLIFFGFSIPAWAVSKGIYITQSTLENTDRINYLAKRASKAGIDTFVVDLDVPSKKYEQNIKILKEHNLKYVARIVMFPDGGNSYQIKTPEVWEKKYALVEKAIGYGASEIQLDYIRYSSKQPASPTNSQDIHRILQWFKNKLAEKNIPLQIDVFGIASFGESKHIGHNIKLFANTIDVLCPMVYPSHYTPFPQHFATPYETVYGSLVAIKSQFPNKVTPFKLNPYIELSNYHYKLSENKKLGYIYAQIQAVEKSGADGWYAWSPHNQYDSLFRVLETYSVK